MQAANKGGFDQRGRRECVAGRTSTAVLLRDFGGAALNQRKASRKISGGSFELRASQA